MDDDLKKTSWNVKQQTRNLPPAKARERIMRYIRRQGFTASPARADGFGVGPNQHHLNYNDLRGSPEHELGHAYMTPPGETLREHQKKMGKLTTPQAQRQMPVEQHRAEEIAAFAMEPGIERRAGVRGTMGRGSAHHFYATNRASTYHQGQIDAARELNAIDEGRKVIGSKGLVGVGTSIDAKINARALGKSDPDIVAPTPAPGADAGPQLPTWTNRPILHPDHVTDLEQAAAVNEFGRKLPRSKAEAEAYHDYVRRHRVEAAAHHLAGMKAADAVGDKEAARKHYTMYKLHSNALGNDAVGAAHPDVVALTEATPPRVYRFKAHKGDAFALAQGGEGKGPLQLHKALHELWQGLQGMTKKEKADDDKAMKAKDRTAKASKTTCPDCGEMKAYWAQTCPSCHRKKYAMGKGEVKATPSACRCPGYKFPHRRGGGACHGSK